ncbi:hypothetical protein [Hymenobacter ruricola]|uniref:Uncharacterized protein n=1 Tax=Hymenobacter ruricola TaxID=2791023 RepID=A0ABS0HXR4_9BACT|nr:hypothetical protein [Hymenobacter ruricola]MBF9219470.1 hypothetical protein [Hymenobacter ruricola]
MKHFLLTTALALLAGCSSVPEEADTTVVPLPMAEVSALRTKLGGLSEEFQKPIYRQVPYDVSGMIARTKWFAEMGGLLRRGNRSGDSVCRKLCAGLYPRLSAQQRALFPQMRQSYIRLLPRDQLMKGAKIEWRDRTINLSATEFNDPGKQARIKTVYERNLRALRFSQMNLIWGNTSKERWSFATGAMADAEVSSNASGYR